MSAKANLFDVDQFIELVKAHPQLYNSTLFEYKSKAVAHNLWNEIAAIMGRTVPECKTVWASLRSSYARHLHNMENNKKANLKKKSRWYLAEKMSFIDQFMAKQLRERIVHAKPEESNVTTSSFDENSISYTNFKFENPVEAMDESSSFVTIKSEEPEVYQQHNQQQQQLQLQQLQQLQQQLKQQLQQELQQQRIQHQLLQEQIRQQEEKQELQMKEQQELQRQEKQQQEQQQQESVQQAEKEQNETADATRETTGPLTTSFTLKKCRVQLSSADQYIIKHRQIEQNKLIQKSEAPPITETQNTLPIKQVEIQREAPQVTETSVPQAMEVDAPKEFPKIVHQQILIPKQIEQQQPTIMPKSIEMPPKELPKAQKPMTMIIPRLTTMEEPVKPTQNDTLKQAKVSPVEKSVPIRKEVDTEAREKSMVMFFQSILFDLRKLSDRNLRLFKQDVLQDLNKHLDEYENED